MDDIIDVIEVKITTMGPGWFHPTVTQHYQVPQVNFQKLLDFMLAWSEELENNKL